MKFKGSQGSWEAVVTYDDGTSETLACVHSDHLAAGRLYHDPGFTDKGHVTFGNTARVKRYIDLIRTKGRVIRTENKIDPSKQRGRGRYKRLAKSYAVFPIINFVIDANGLRFDFCPRLIK